MRNKNKITPLIFSLLLTLLLSVLIQAQSKDNIGKASIHTPDGVLFITNTKDRSFTFEIKGKNIKPMPGGNNPTFIVDEKILQIVTVETDLFITDKKKHSEEEILELHKVWESDYLGEVFGTALKVDSEPTTVKGLKALFWGFKRQKLNTEFDKDYFLTTLIGKNLLGLSSPVRPDQSLADYKKFFVGIMETLKISDKPFDVEKLAEDIRQSQNKGN